MKLFFCRMIIIVFVLSIVSFAWSPQADADWGVEIVTNIYSPCYASHPAYGSYYCGSKTNKRFEYEGPPEPPNHYQYYLDQYNKQRSIHVAHEQKRRTKRQVIYRKENSCSECDLGAVN